jgi:hypothetical protein
MENKRQSLIDGLREIAQFLEDHPDVPTPLIPRLDAFVYSKEAFSAAARAVGGHQEKKDYGIVIALRRMFGDVSYDLNIQRDLVCERVVTGTRIIPEQPAVPEHEEEIVEWKCSSVLAE